MTSPYHKTFLASRTDLTTTPRCVSGATVDVLHTELLKARLLCAPAGAPLEPRRAIEAAFGVDEALSSRNSVRLQTGSA